MSDPPAPPPPASAGAARALERLRAAPQQVDALVTLGVDALLDRPVSELVDPHWLASAVAQSIRAAARSDELERWIASRLAAALAHVDPLSGPVGAHIPVTLLEPLERALARELTPDERLVRVFVDHPSFRELLADLLRENLLAFGRKLRNMVPDAPRGRGKSSGGMGLASALAGVAKGVASAVGQEVERQLEDRVRSYVEDVLGDVVDTTVRRVADPERAGAMAAWRVDVLHGLLREPLEHLVAERHKYPPELIAADLGSILRALAGWRQLTESVEALVGHVFAHYGEHSARSFLDGSGLDEAWRPPLESLLSAQIGAVVRTDAFAAWFTELVDGPDEG